MSDSFTAPLALAILVLELTEKVEFPMVKVMALVSTALTTQWIGGSRWTGGAGRGIMLVVMATALVPATFTWASTATGTNRVIASNNRAVLIGDLFIKSSL